MNKEWFTKEAMQSARRNMRISGRGSLTRMIILFGAAFDSNGRNCPRQNGGRIRIEIPFPSATEGGLNSLQFEKGGFNLLLSLARFFLFLLTRSNEKRAGDHSNLAFCLSGENHVLSKLNRPCRS